MKRQRYRYRFQDIVLFSTSSPILQRAMCKKWKEKFALSFRAYFIQELGGKVRTVGPLYSYGSQCILDKLLFIQ